MPLSFPSTERFAVHPSRQARNHPQYTSDATHTLLTITPGAFYTDRPWESFEHRFHESIKLRESYSLKKKKLTVSPKVWKRVAFHDIRAIWRNRLKKVFETKGSNKSFAVRLPPIHVKHVHTRARSTRQMNGNVRILQQQVGIACDGRSGVEYVNNMY